MQQPYLQDWASPLQIAAVVYFWLVSLFNNNFILTCVVTIMLMAADFWTVKNVTGRLLVGLRWWNDGGTESNENTWRFESLEEVIWVFAPDLVYFLVAAFLNPLVAWDWSLSGNSWLQLRIEWVSSPMEYVFVMYSFFKFAVLPWDSALKHPY